MNQLLRVRGTVLSLLEQARGDKYDLSPLYGLTLLTRCSDHRRVKSSLEAEVDVVIPLDAAGTDLAELLQREGAMITGNMLTGCIHDVILQKLS